MNWLDYVLIALLGFCMMRSFMRGITREIIGMAAAIAAVVLGMWFYTTIGAAIRPWFSSDRTSNFLGFLIIVAATIVVGALASALVRRFVKAVGLSFMDRLLGAGFGLLRGAIIAITLLAGYMALGPGGGAKTAPSAVVHSQIAPYLMEASRVVVDVAPMSLKRSFREEYDQVKAEILQRARPDNQSVVK